MPTSVVFNASLKALATIAGFSKKIPLAAENPVAENIFLGGEPIKKYGIVDYKTMHLNAQKMLKSINVTLNSESIVGELNTSQWQIIEICKALAKKPKFIVMDEPTASLDEKQIDNLFDIINTLKGNGIGIIYISHKLNVFFRKSQYLLSVSCMTIFKLGYFVFK